MSGLGQKRPAAMSAAMSGLPESGRPADIRIRVTGFVERRHASLVRLDVGELDYLGPLLYVIRDTLAEVGWRAR
jgi:hypothetical protein